MTDFIADSARWIFVCIATTALSACASSGVEPEADYGEAQWAANGWLSPDRAGEPELIGLYTTRRACEAAVKDWMASEVAGLPVSGDCLPIDRH
jgi:hypothetical protein